MVKILNPQIAKIVPRLDQSNAWVIRVLVLIGIVAVLGLTVTYMASSKLASIDYQVYGKVQEVFFRKYTKSKAESLGLVGWVKNTNEGTVAGTIQGLEEKVKNMRKWLQTEGSPKSKISKCEFTNERFIADVEHHDFRVVK